MDPPVVNVAHPGGRAPILLIGDHAGRAIPSRLHNLGVSADDLERHIAWDIGVAALGQRLAPMLDAAFVHQAYSRLVIDCNRRSGAPDRCPPVSDGAAVPGNVGLSAADLDQRVEEIYQPYQDAIAAELDRRPGAPLISLHSFTPTMQGFARPWRMGVLHREDSPLSMRMLAELRQALGDEVGDNQPYKMDPTDNTVPLHVDPRGIDYLEIEVRQDLLADAAGQAWAAGLLADCLGRALA